MKRMAAAILAALLMTVAMVQGASAQEPPRRPHDRFDREGRGEGTREGMPGRPPGREAVWPGPAQPGQQGQDGHGSHGRMSPEERQQLRRDINSHGRDIYRERGRR